MIDLPRAKFCMHNPLVETSVYLLKMKSTNFLSQQSPAYPKAILCHGALWSFKPALKCSETPSTTGPSTICNSILSGLNFSFCRLRLAVIHWRMWFSCIEILRDVEINRSIFGQQRVQSWAGLLMNKSFVIYSHKSVLRYAAIKTCVSNRNKAEITVRYDIHSVLELNLSPLDWIGPRLNQS